MDSVKSKMNNLIDSMKEQLFEMGDAIYDHPEIGLQEVFALSLIHIWKCCPRSYEKVPCLKTAAAPQQSFPVSEVR